MDDSEQKSLRIFISFFTFFGIVSAIVLTILFLASCTLNLQNISSNGKSTDLVDDTDTISPTVSPNINIPVSALP